MKIKGKSENFQYFFIMLLKNSFLFLLYLAVILILPIFSIFYENPLLPFISLIYQIGGILLLFIDEKYKMNRASYIYSKSNTYFLKILDSQKMIRFAIENMYFYLINPSLKDSDLTANISFSDINYNYDKIKNNNKEKERIKAFESELNNLKYFSAVRKAGYVLLSIGFVLQFLTLILIKS